MNVSKCEIYIYILQCVRQLSGWKQCCRAEEPGRPSMVESPSSPLKNITSSFKTQSEIVKQSTVSSELQSTLHIIITIKHGDGIIILASEECYIILKNSHLNCNQHFIILTFNTFRQLSGGGALSTTKLPNIICSNIESSKSSARQF